MAGLLMFGKGLPVRERFDNLRLVLTNPGLLRLPVEQVYTGGESKARNQRMQQMLRMIGYGEGLGSGFPLILDAWGKERWTKPELVEQSALLQVKLIMHINLNPKKGETNSDIKDDIKEDTKDVTQNDDVLKELSDRQIEILQDVLASPQITAKEIADRLKVSVRSIRRELEIIRQHGISLQRVRGKDYGHWTVSLPSQQQ